MSKITIVTAIVCSDREKEYGWAYRISKGRRRYQHTGVLSDVESIIEAELKVFKMMCSFLHKNLSFEEDTKITIVSESREIVRLMRYGNIAEIGELRNNPEVMAVVKDILEYRNTQARCIYKFISYDEKDKINQELAVLAAKTLKNE